ncbi:aldo/keto reductase [Nibrella saemangeumensis]|uniref:Aldo/keto reductase n=1 Tax=Nibrella saemangeumensis TaxID=1084526 RepID=A0ABP8NBS6_9BACT
MRRRKLGNTGIEVSEVAFGGVEIGMPYGLGIHTAADMLNEEEAIELLRAALDAGISFFDTARMYGSSERIMGKAFRDRRDEVVLCTKCRHFRDATGALPAHDEIKGFIEASVQESLAALQTSYIDVYMLHQADLEILENTAIASSMLDLKERGVIRATGVSVYTPEETQKAIEGQTWDVIQLPFNLLDQRQGSLFDKAYTKGIGLVIRSVLLKGLLSDRGKNLHPALRAVETHIQGYQDYLTEEYPTLPALATKFALSHKEVTSVLVGIDRMEYLHQALATADGRYLSDTQLKKVKQQAFPEPEFLNLPHWDRMGWLR